jgi:hypothetical protein
MPSIEAHIAVEVRFKHAADTRAQMSPAGRRLAVELRTRPGNDSPLDGEDRCRQKRQGRP